jgi:hypothetical protein
MEKDQGGWPHSGTVEVLAIGASTAVENTGVVWRSAIIEVRVYSSCIDFFFFENGDSRLQLATCGREATIVGPLSVAAYEHERGRIRRPHLAFPFYNCQCHVSSMSKFRFPTSNSKLRRNGEEHAEHVRFQHTT